MTCLQSRSFTGVLVNMEMKGEFVGGPGPSKGGQKKMDGIPHTLRHWPTFIKMQSQNLTGVKL